MPTIGLDCEIILDGQGYWVERESFAVRRPRIRRADVTRVVASGGAGVGERYVDQGPGKREWTFMVICWQAIRDFTGAVVTTTGQQYRDALHASYEKVNATLSFTDPAGHVWSVRFDDLVEGLVDVRAGVDGELQYICHVT